MAGSKNNPENRAKVAEQLTRRQCADGCGELIPANSMLTVMATSFSPDGKVAKMRKHFIKSHYKGA